MKKELMKVLIESGIKAAVKKLGDYEYRDYCLFNADVAESVLHIFEVYNDGKAPRLAVEGIRKWHKGEISDEELRALADAASDTYVTSHAADYAACYATSYAACYAAAAYDEKWQEIEQIFVKHFGG